MSMGVRFTPFFKQTYSFLHPIPCILTVTNFREALIAVEVKQTNDWKKIVQTFQIVLCGFISRSGQCHLELAVWSLHSCETSKQQFLYFLRENARCV